MRKGIFSKIFGFAVIAILFGAKAHAGISGYISGCNNGLCTAQLKWDVKAASRFVVTVEMPHNSTYKDTLPKVFSCGDGAGAGEAPWIGFNQLYVFKVYESPECSASVALHQFPVDRLGITAQGPQPAPTLLQGVRDTCAANGLCSFDLNWSSKVAQKTVLTVEMWGQPGEKVVSCELSQGAARVDWVSKGKVYRFRLYESPNCNSNIGKNLKPAAQFLAFEP